MALATMVNYSFSSMSGAIENCMGVYGRQDVAVMHETMRCVGHVKQLKLQLLNMWHQQLVPVLTVPGSAWREVYVLLASLLSAR
jgi:hypothetical protein